MAIVIPVSIEALFELPGRDWSSKDRQRVIRWLFEPTQFTYLVRFCLYHLGPNPLTEDAEDAWAEFCATRLEAVLLTYDPLKGRRFWNYLLFCLERECGHYRRKLARQDNAETPLEIQLPGDDDVIEIVLTADESGSPGTHVETQEMLALLNRCLATLPPRHRQAFVMVELQALDYAEAATSINEKPGTIRVWACRARAALRECLRQGGYTYE